jgi:hypothetical protein
VTPAGKIFLKLEILMVKLEISMEYAKTLLLWISEVFQMNWGGKCTNYLSAETSLTHTNSVL